MNGQLGKSPSNYPRYSGHFDETATLATVSTLSMSSSEEELPRNPIVNTPRYTRKQKQSNSSYSNSDSNNNKDSNKNKNKNKGKGKGKGRKSRGRHAMRSTSTKTHDQPMKRRDIYFALDCEMVGVGPNGLDSALARVSVVNWDNEIVLDTYVKVDVPVTDYRTFVSGITPEQIQSDSAMTLTEVQKLVTSTLQGKILIGHGLKNDLTVIGINHPWCDIRDTATFKPLMRSQESRSAEEQSTLCPRKLRDLVWEKLGKQIQVMGKAHSPVEDAIAAMDLYKEVRNDWEMEMVRQVNTATRANDERCRQMPTARGFPQEAPALNMSNMALFPTNQYPMRYAPSPPSSISHTGQGQASFYASRLAEEHARVSRAAIAHHQMMLQLHC